MQREEQKRKKLSIELKKEINLLNEYLKDLLFTTKIPEDVNNNERGFLKCMKALESQMFFLDFIKKKVQNPNEKMLEEETAYATLLQQIPQFLKRADTHLLELEIKKRSLVIHEMKKYCNNTNNTSPFTDFYSLTLVINHMYLDRYIKEKEALDIIMYLISKNIELGILEKNGIERMKNVHELDKKIIVLLKETKAPQAILDIISTILNTNTMDFKKEFISATKDVQEHYLNKKEKYTVEDMEIVLQALKRMHIIFVENDMIKKALLKQIVKTDKRKGIDTRVTKKVIEIVPYAKVKIKPPQEYYPTNGEVKALHVGDFAKVEVISNKKVSKTEREIKEELEKIVNLQTLQFKRTISTFDKFYIANLLVSLEKSRTEIQTFLAVADQTLENSIATCDFVSLKQFFLANREKYYFYYQTKGKLELGDTIHFIEEGFELLEDETNNDFKKALINEIKNELIRLEHQLPATYEYEFRKLEEKQKIRIKK